MDASILFKDGDWSLEEIGNWGKPAAGYVGGRTRYVSLVKHVCYPNGRLDGVPGNTIHQVVCYPDDTEYCWRCSEEIPQGIMVMWKFQNWETLSYGET